MKEKLFIFIRHISRFGIISGVAIYFKTYFLTASDSHISLKNLSFPILLRKKTSDVKIFNQVFLNREYDYKLTIEPKFIIDCGANIGLASLFFKSKYPNATICAIEPETSNYKALVSNTNRHDSITTIQSGIWNKNVLLKVEDIWNFGKWGFVCSETDVEAENTTKAISISEIMKRFNREEIDILKMDIEGAELEVFSSNYEEWLPKTKVIMIELHDAYRKGCSKAFFTALVKYDFSVYSCGENMVCIRNQ